MGTDNGALWGGRRGVIVTGASSGIGAAVAAEWARAGYRVIGASRRGTIPNRTSEMIPVELDVTDHASLERLVSETANSADGLAGVVQCSGFQKFFPSATLSMNDLRSILETNLVSSVRLAQLSYPHLQGGGFVAFTGSFYADLGVKGSLAYSASKAALSSVTRTLAVEWGESGISVVNFAPGYVATELNADYFADQENQERVARRIPVKRIGKAEEIARLVVSVLTSDCAYLTGETIAIDGAHGISL